MNWSLLWSFLPDWTLPILIVGVALAVLLGVLKLRAAIPILAMLLAFPILGPFVESLFGQLPPWLALLTFVALTFGTIRAVMALFIGHGATSVVVGHLVVDVIRSCLTLVFLPVRLLFAGLAAGARGRARK